MENEILIDLNNGDAYKLGLAVSKMEKYPKNQIGDEIDRGLIFNGLLREKGFALVRLEDKRINGK